MIAVWLHEATTTNLLLTVLKGTYKGLEHTVHETEVHPQNLCDVSGFYC